MRLKWNGKGRLLNLPKPAYLPTPRPHYTDTDLRRIALEKGCTLWEAICWLRYGRSREVARP